VTGHTAACGQDARVPGPLHAGKMPAYPDRCMRAGCPRTRAAACGQDARVPGPLHAGKMPTYPGRCMRAGCPRTQTAALRAGCPRTQAAACGQDARVPGPLHAGKKPAYPVRRDACVPGPRGDTHRSSAPGTSYGRAWVALAGTHPAPWYRLSPSRASSISEALGEAGTGWTLCCEPFTFGCNPV